MNRSNILQTEELASKKRGLKYVSAINRYVMSTGVVDLFPIEEEYKKNPDITPDDISKLRQWLDTQPHLPGQHITDLDLLITFHCCERSAEVAKQVLDLHFTLRTLFTNFFKDRQVDQRIEASLDTLLFCPLPTPTVEGYRSFYCRLLDPDPRNFSFPEAVRIFMMIFDLWQREEGTWPGFVLMIDMDTARIGHITKLEPMMLRQVVYFLQEVMLIRLKGLHFLNAPPFMDRLLMLLRPFMKKSLLDMLRVHQVDADSLYSMQPKESFPKESGGEYKDLKTIREETVLRLRNNAALVAAENNRRVDETKRPGGKKTTVEDLFGIQGSFKKLDID